MDYLTLMNLHHEKSIKCNWRNGGGMGESHLVKKPVIRHVLIKSGCIHKNNPNQVLQWLWGKAKMWWTSTGEVCFCVEAQQCAIELMSHLKLHRLVLYFPFLLFLKFFFFFHTTHTKHRLFSLHSPYPSPRDPLRLCFPSQKSRPPKWHHPNMAQPDEKNDNRHKPSCQG